MKRSITNEENGYYMCYYSVAGEKIDSISCALDRFGYVIASKDGAISQMDQTEMALKLKIDH